LATLNEAARTVFEKTAQAKRNSTVRALLPRSFSIVGAVLAAGLETARPLPAGFPRGHALVGWELRGTAAG
jgi:hypothetical protein